MWSATGISGDGRVTKCNAESFRAGKFCVTVTEERALLNVQHQEYAKLNCEPAV